MIVQKNTVIVQFVWGVVLLLLAANIPGTNLGAEENAWQEPTLPDRVASDKTTEGPIGTIHRTRYIRTDRARCAAVVTHFYRGTGPVREEYLSTETSSDIYIAPRRRVSMDNGKTWSEWETLPEDEMVQNGCYKSDCFVTAQQMNPACHKVARIVLQRIFDKDIRQKQPSYPRYWDHSIIELSDDDGKTFTSPRLVSYEPGADFDPADWLKEEYLENNTSYSGYNFVTDPNGDILFSATAAVPLEEENTTVSGIRFFRGHWNEEEQRFDWENPSSFGVSTKVSGYGLIEPFLVRLSDGTLYIDMRGTTDNRPEGVEGLADPHHWYSISHDNGKTWERVTDLKFDTGESFWSPSSFAKLIRSSQTGKLYWIGNIALDSKPSGNWPRFPLYIAEFDEEKVALKKDTLTVIDTREDADASPSVQFSNFSLIENRETGTFEIFLTRYGERGDSLDIDYNEADVFKYEITLK